MPEPNNRSPNSILVSEIPLFQKIPQELAQTIAASLRLRQLSQGEEVFGEPHSNDHIWFVISGAIRVAHVASNGREVILVERLGGEFLGLFEQPVSANMRFRIVATQASVLATMSSSELVRILRSSPDILQRLLCHGVDFTRTLCERLVELATLKVRHRIYAELLRLASSRQGAINTLALSPAPRHSELANRVSTHREAVTRELGSLEKLGVIERVDGQLLIHNAAFLREQLLNAR